jgi:protein SCO1/2
LSRVVVAAGIASLVLLATFIQGCGSGGESVSPEPSPTDDALRGMVFSEPLPKPHFVLADTDGKPFDFFNETQGQITLLYFGYTWCADICPTHMADVSAVLKRDGTLAENVRTVFVTVDPERDTPNRLSSWLDLFDSDFIGLTGTPEEIDTALRDSLGSRYFPVKKYHKDSADDMKYEVSHAAFVIAYGKDNMAPVAFTVDTTQEDYAHDLNVLLAQGES